MLLIAACLATSAFFAAEVVSLPARQRRRNVRRAAAYGNVRLRAEREEQSFRVRVVRPLRERLARVALRTQPRTTVEAVGLRLLAAGLGRKLTPTGFLALKTALAGVGLVGGAALGGSSSGAQGALLMGLAGAGLGFVGPDFVVSSRTRRRKEELRAQLPQALDLLAVSVEAGLAFDGALAKLAEHMEGPLTDEFSLTLGEIRIGESRAGALKKMAERSDVPEISSFVRSVVQADQLGISLGRILRVQASESRLKRQAAAEEKAMKAPIKMLFPTAGFIFPAMFIVILGPAFLQLSKIL